MFDELVVLIKRSPTPEIAAESIMDLFGLNPEDETRYFNLTQFREVIRLLEGVAHDSATQPAYRRGMRRAIDAFAFNVLHRMSPKRSTVDRGKTA